MSPSFLCIHISLPVRKIRNFQSSIKFRQTLREACSLSEKFRIYCNGFCVRKHGSKRRNETKIERERERVRERVREWERGREKQIEREKVNVSKGKKKRKSWLVGWLTLSYVINCFALGDVHWAFIKLCNACASSTAHNFKAIAILYARCNVQHFNVLALSIQDLLLTFWHYLQRAFTIPSKILW